MDIEQEIADEISGIQVGSGYYSITIGIDAAQEAAAALMPLVRRAQADKVREAAELVMDPRDGLPFNADHDLAIVSAWLDETADRIEQNSEGRQQ